MPALDFMRSKVCQTCDLDGLVGDCGCEFDTVNQANQEHFQPLLRELVQRTFFRYFKVNLNKQCPFWHEEMMCSIRDCAVVECEAAEVPPPSALEGAPLVKQQAVSQSGPVPLPVPGPPPPPMEGGTAGIDRLRV